jgi:peptidyl-tRNA hydrolase, PTH1 family
LTESLFTGLGNPGPKYQETRHNVGFLVLEELSHQFGFSWRKPFFSPFRFAKGKIEGHPLLLVEPLTYMNRSGEAFSSIFRRFSVGIENLVVVCDNLDLPPGEIRIKKGGSTAGHNGLKSIVACTGSSDFCRIYVGIGRPEKESVVEHVLGIPDEAERRLLNQGISRAVEAARLICMGESLSSVMNHFNRRNSDPLIS